MRVLSSRQRESWQWPEAFGRLYGEGQMVVAFTNHRWPTEPAISLYEASAIQSQLWWAESEARRRYNEDDVRRKIHDS